MSDDKCKGTIDVIAPRSPVAMIVSITALMISVLTLLKLFDIQRGK